MKKLYATEEWKRRSSKRSLRTLKRKRKSCKYSGGKEEESKEKSEEKRNSKSARASYENVKKRKGRIEIKAPANFSLINNIDETLLFFDTVHYYSTKNQQKIYFDLSEVKELTTDAILYTLSRLEYYHERRVNIIGNNPNDETCDNMLLASGFYKYVYSQRVGKTPSDSNIYSIESGSTVLPQKAQEVKNFAARCLNKSDLSDTRSIYTTLIECMANTKHHAYAARSLHSKWWLMASYDQNSKKIHFTFLDNGFGIPRTIRKKNTEKINEKLREMVSKVVAVESLDAILINSALKGEFRTQTSKAYRGKGLPRIYETAQQNKIDTLVIISRKGFVNSSSREVRPLKRIFYGTLLSWQFL
ncbi:hypothetical protein [Candidatus Manganitrophus noduliformans]|uniref:ATP-binding protein n=1 Tax=Candidatus Manganitrophus noduliformans TaxID=2606439 RepID=A0A7X6IBW1_9BACT|nr:hypothetical protein [Candidatus Manganitrophus noduliformans]NKE71860.1 hypothetical protein [Candidatus Manganitrophus noduliformans]